MNKGKKKEREDDSARGNKRSERRGKKSEWEDREKKLRKKT